MAETIAIASGIIAIIAGISRVGGASFSLRNSTSTAVQRLYSFERELEEFIQLWQQVQDFVDLQDRHLSEGLRRAFLGFIERTNQDLHNASREFERFRQREEEYDRADWNWISLYLLCGSSPKRKRKMRLQDFMDSNPVEVHRHRLRSNTSSIVPWLQIVAPVRHDGRGNLTPEQIQWIRRGCARHQRYQAQQYIQEERARVGHVHLSLLDSSIEAADRRGSPIERRLHELGSQLSRSTLRSNPSPDPPRQPAVTMAHVSPRSSRENAGSLYLDNALENEREARTDARYYRHEYERLRDAANRDRGLSRHARNDLLRLQGELVQERAVAQRERLAREQAERQNHGIAGDLTTLRNAYDQGQRERAELRTRNHATSVELDTLQRRYAELQRQHERVTNGALVAESPRSMRGEDASWTVPQRDRNGSSRRPPREAQPGDRPASSRDQDLSSRGEGGSDRLRSILTVRPPPVAYDDRQRRRRHRRSGDSGYDSDSGGSRRSSRRSSLQRGPALVVG